MGRGWENTKHSAHNTKANLVAKAKEVFELPKDTVRKHQQGSVAHLKTVMVAEASYVE